MHHGQYNGPPMLRPRFVAAEDMPWPTLHLALHAAADLAIAHSCYLTVTGWFSDQGVYLCPDRCCEGLRGTYTVIPDVDHIEFLANHAEPPEGTAMISRPDGRSVAVLPGSPDTKRPWEGQRL